MYLGLHSILANVHDKFTAYNQRSNDLEEQLADLTAKFVQLVTKNQSIHAWYTGHIISVWKGLQQLGEWMTRSMGTMVQVMGDDNAKYRHLAELMEEVHLCLGIPFQNPLPSAHTFLPPVDIKPLAILRDTPPLQVPMATSPAKSLVDAPHNLDPDLLQGMEMSLSFIVKLLLN